ncbi:CYFA0S10e03598g1_1 [Cyberlindnera fabianii]|uniref:CYFA0S10e03598g1_1 n=1 Tax=Cyberlindnera fabianii TaxID=36022 RepID=A0A061B7M4_CYBFA|nr:CYFA0S10e03598g1_1 [Cyberlindnera fabianii]
MSDTEEKKPQVAGEDQKDESITHINLKVSDGQSEIFFKIKRSTPLKRLMEAFAKRQGKALTSLRFFADGTRVTPESTPDELELEDGDVIEAHQEQVCYCHYRLHFEWDPRKRSTNSFYSSVVPSKLQLFYVINEFSCLFFAVLNWELKM